MITTLFVRIERDSRVERDNHAGVRRDYFSHSQIFAAKHEWDDWWIASLPFAARHKIYYQLGKIYLRECTCTQCAHLNIYIAFLWISSLKSLYRFTVYRHTVYTLSLRRVIKLYQNNVSECACRVKPVTLEFREHSAIAWNRFLCRCVARVEHWKAFSMFSSISGFEAIGLITMRVVVFAS